MTRPAMLLLGLMVAGCRVNRTVVLNDVESYDRRKTVVAVEGYEVHWNDGGRLTPAARRGLCLVEVDETTARVGDDDVLVHVLAGEPGEECTAPLVRRPVSVSVEGDTLTILGRDSGVRVPTQAAYAVRVIGAKQGEVAKGARHEPRSLPLVVTGIVAIMGGIGGGAAILVAEGQDTSNDHASGPKIGWAALSLAAGFGAGIPMIVIGAKEVRASDEAASLELGPGSARIAF